MAKKLTDEETLKCFKAYREYNDENAITLLIKANQGLIGTIIKRYYDKGLTNEELMASGNVGLYNAINKYDYTKGLNMLSTYMGTAIENQIKMDLRRVRKHDSEMSIYEPVTYNRDGEELTLEDLISVDEDEMFKNVVSQMRKDEIATALRCLTDFERQVILLRYGLEDEKPKTQQEVANTIGYSKQYVSYTEDRAIKKMRMPRISKKLKDFIDE